MAKSPDVLNLRSANDLLATLPYLMGEPPVPGLVILVLNKGRVQGRMLRDLNRPSTVDAATSARIVTNEAKNSGDALLFVAFGTGEQVTEHADQILAAATEGGLQITDALRVHQGRYWSYTCQTPDCCPPEGTQIDPDRSTGPAEAVLHGMARDRGLNVDPVTEARLSLEPSTSVPPEEVEAAVEAVKEEVAHLLRAGVTDLDSHRVEEAYTALEAERTGNGPASLTDLVRLAVFVDSTKVRDAVGLKIPFEVARTHLDLWSRVTRTAPPALRAAPATLVALAAWVDDNLTMAQAAVHTALEADPNYHLAHLVQKALEVGLPPAKWAAALQSKG